MARQTQKSTPEEETPGAPKNGILVSIERRGDGVQLEIAPFGDVSQTEVPVLLGIARNLKEQELGIGRG